MTHEWFADENRDLLSLVVALGRNPADIAPVYLESARAVLDSLTANSPAQVVTVEDPGAVPPDPSGPILNSWQLAHVLSEQIDDAAPMNMHGRWIPLAERLWPRLANSPSLDREAIEDAVLGIELTREFDVTEDDAAIIADAILAPIPPALGNAIPGLQAAVDMAEALTIRPGNSRAEQHRNEDESWTS